MEKHETARLRVLVVEPGARPRIQEIPDTLAAMQELVGGTIQLLYPFDEPVALICNDEGKLLNLPLNRELRDNRGTLYDIVCGTFFLCGTPPDSDLLGSLTEEQIERFARRFHSPEYFINIGGSLLCLPMEP
ncbi:MAG: DUF3846 domain-containing protein [Clostridiales bacterium]|nr:DUF3846 domain-containing protein [Clostridiales bacterium]